MITFGSVRVCMFAFAVTRGWGGRTRRGERVRKSFTKEGTLKLGINRYRASTL